MSRLDRVLERLLAGGSDANTSFADLCNLLEGLGFERRIRGSHHIFTRVGVDEILNIQPKAGKSKPYQVKQVRNVLLKYRLGGSSE